MPKSPDRSPTLQVPKELNLLKKLVKVEDSESSLFTLDKPEKGSNGDRSKQTKAHIDSKTTNILDGGLLKPNSVYGFDSNDEEEEESEDEDENEISKLTAMHEGGEKDK